MTLTCGHMITHCYAVVMAIPHHLVLDLLPALQTLVYQYLP